MYNFGTQILPQMFIQHYLSRIILIKKLFDNYLDLTIITLSMMLFEWGHGLVGKASKPSLCHGEHHRIKQRPLYETCNHYHLLYQFARLLCLVVYRQALHALMNTANTHCQLKKRTKKTQLRNIITLYLSQA